MAPKKAPAASRSSPVIEGVTARFPSGRVPYDRWLTFIWPLLAVLTALIMIALSVGPLVA